MTFHFHICHLAASGVLVSWGTAARRGFGMGDLTDVGKSLIAFLHYWWMFYFHLCNQRLCFLSLTLIPTTQPPLGLSGEAATDPQFIETLKVFLKQTKQLVDIWLDMRQALDEKYGSCLATCPTLTDYMSVSHPSIHEGRTRLGMRPRGEVGGYDIELRCWMSTLTLTVWKGLSRLAS